MFSRSIRIILFLLPAIAIQLNADFERIDGQIDGAPYSVWLPEEDNRILYIFAPGYRPETASRSIAVNAAEDPVLRPRLESGWTIATTAYQKNGWAVKEGIQDIQNLIRELIQLTGEFRYIMIEGHSMGGLIAVHLAELNFDINPITGILAVGSPILISGSRLKTLGGSVEDLEFTFQPSRAVLFVSNFNELRGPLHYVGKASEGEAWRMVAAMTLERPGHVNITADERSQSLDILYDWVSGEPPTRLGDATIAVPEAVSEGKIGDGLLSARITRLDPDYGNIDINASFSDLQSLGLDFGDRVGLRVGEERRIARIGDRYASVPQGDWVVVVLPDGLLRIAINMGNASEDIQGFPDDEIELLTVEE